MIKMGALDNWEGEVNLALGKGVYQCARDKQCISNIIVDSVDVLVVVIDKEGEIKYFNNACERLTGYWQSSVVGKKFTEIFGEVDLEITEQKFKQCVTSKEGESRLIYWSLTRPISKTSLNQLIVCSGTDVTKLVGNEERLRFLSMHDFATGLFNRAFFEEEMERLQKGEQHPIGIIVIDIDGLKMINDILGHKAGDEIIVTTAKLIKQSFRQGDIVARIGGDEFAVLLPKCSKQTLKEASKRIYDAVAVYNVGRNYPLSLSLGYAISDNKSPKCLVELFKEADRKMYCVKVRHSNKMSNKMLDNLIKTLAEKESKYSPQVSLEEVITKVCKVLNLNTKRLANLHLLARFHDIGEAGLPECIFTKTEQLNAEELAEVRRHCELGYRIAKFTPELVGISDLILKHHEWWNGQGYPLGLKGEEIPLECRIFAIASAYTAMTNKRPYRNAMTEEQCLNEICRCSGTQFDPKLVDIFLQVMGE